MPGEYRRGLEVYAVYRGFGGERAEAERVLLPCALLCWQGWSMEGRIRSGLRFEYISVSVT